ncbi:MAG: mannose-ethanolamine phosphotransferase gpi13 [Claussenomyces sp. TS43310]|nr:MAG: mannose-ethanolamine phosphotransferase gpi13 [Claussenomyces sp. TS43310]
MPSRSSKSGKVDPVAKAEDLKNTAAQSAKPNAPQERHRREVAGDGALKERVPNVGPKVTAGQAVMEERARAKVAVFKRAWGWSIGFFAWSFFVHATGIFLFTKGFLLTRLVLDQRSSCTEPPIPLPSSFRGAGTPERGCWHPRAFEKAVVVIIDALRYDFTVPFNSSSRFPSPQVFHNALPLLYDTAVNEPQNAFLLPFIADPPTTTLQRLKGLTTGTLPTFIDAGSNFAGTAIEEDNLLIQLRQAGRRMVHLGDDTWTALFPGYFEENLSRAYDSFNVWDLHTVDNGVTEHILPLLSTSKRSEWDVVFAHYLGVDHAGHRYGPDHPAMTAKLQQMDGVLRDIVAALDDDTLLVVMGDHGMDSKGDHGGESDDEVEAALWMYSKKGVFGRTEPDFTIPPQTAKERPVGQIDLVPTLALLLGLPIPFNNLGSPIKEAFIGRKGKGWENLKNAASITAAAVKRYQSAYYKARGLEEDGVGGTLQGLWSNALQNSASSKAKESSWRESYALFSAYQRETLKIYRGLWARFDVPSMMQGIVILAAGVLVLILYARSVADNDEAVIKVELEQAERKLESQEVAKGAQDEKVDIDLTESIVTGALIGSAAGGSLGSTVAMMSPEGSILNEGLFAAAVGGLLGALIAQLGSLKAFRNPMPSGLWSWLAIIFTVSQAIGFASNSYTIWEDSILLFFISTFGLLAAFSCLRQASMVNRALGVYHSALFVLLGWISSFSRLCREEQMPFCRSTYYSSAASSTSAPWQLLIPFLVAVLLPSVIRSYYTSTRSYEGFAPVWIGVTLRGGLFAAAIFWTLDAADDGDWIPSMPKGALKSARVVIAQTVFALALAAGTTAFVWATPCVSISTHKPAEGSTKTKATVTVMGYANVHGTRYALLVFNILLTCLMVQKPMGWLSLSLCTWQILSLLEILDVLQLSSRSIGPTMLALLASLHFFKTGHQATLSSIQWESAFVPLHEIRYPYSPVLVALNTFGAHILCAVAVPLTVLWKAEAKQHPRRLVARVARAWATFALYFAVESLATTLWAAHLRRHLMLYRIFNPRFMVAALALLVLDVVGVAIALLGSRVNALGIADVFGWA